MEKWQIRLAVLFIVSMTTACGGITINEKHFNEPYCSFSEATNGSFEAEYVQEHLERGDSEWTVSLYTEADETDELNKAEMWAAISARNGEITDVLWQHVPEFSAYATHISVASEGQANLIMMVPRNAKERVYRDLERTIYIGCYYAVYVGESWRTHTVRWDTFLVNVERDSVLWQNTAQLKGDLYATYTLEEWRESRYYRYDLREE